MSKIAVLCIEPDLTELQTLKRRLELEPDFVFLGVADFAEAIAYYPDLHPHIMLLALEDNYRLTLSTLYILQHRLNLTNTVIIALSSQWHNQSDLTERLLGSGCKGVIDKPVTGELNDQIKAIRDASEPQLAPHLTDLYRQKNEADFLELHIALLIENKKLKTQQSSIRDSWVATEALLEVGQNTVGIMHDTKSALNGVALNLAHLDPSDAITPTDRHLHFQYAMQSLDTLKKIVLGTLDQAHPLPQEMEKLDLVQVIEEAAKPILEQPMPFDIEFNTPNLRRAYWVLGISTQLQRLFKNLIENSIQAIITQGALTQGGIEKHELFIDITQNYTQITVEIFDTGTGIQKDRLHHVTDFQYTTKPDGHGIGLYICAEIAQSHGAKLSYENRQRQGVISRLVIPAATH